MTRLHSCPGEAGVQACRVQLHRLSGLPGVHVVHVPVVAHVDAVYLDGVPAGVLALDGQRRRRRRRRPTATDSDRLEAVRRARLGRVAPVAGRLAAWGLHHPPHVLVQDALRVFLVGVAEQRAAVGQVPVAGAVVLRVSTRGQPVTG